MYSHALTVAYTVETEHTAEELTYDELLEALKRRVRMIEEDREGEALLCDPPFDTYEF